MTRGGDGPRISEYYNMGHAKRGMAVIFNHSVVSALPLQNRMRKGSKNDWETLETTLKNLKFEVRVEHDLELNDIKKKLNEVQNEDHSQHDCLVIAVLTFGEKGKLYSDDTSYEIDMILEKFTATNCPLLASKPKIILIQACEFPSERRGNLESTETDSQSHLIPNHADFLIEYSTIPGSFSWDHRPERCSWFIQFLCEELDKRGKDTNLLTLLTITKQRIDHEYKIYRENPEHRVFNKVGVPITTYMLTRKLKFTAK